MYSRYHPGTMANSIDFKIGCKLFEDSAAKNKKAKMQAYSSATTADHFGVIVSGLKTLDPETSTYLKFPKKYGYALTAATLPLGVRQYFVDARGRLAHRHHIPTLISQLKERLLPQYLIIKCML
jgi:hypothetical protein